MFCLRIFLSLLVIFSTVISWKNVYADDRVAAGISTETPFKDIRYSKDDWGKEFLITLESGPKYLSKDMVLNIPPAPENDSETTKQELALLKKFEKEDRTTENVELINNEADLLISIYARDGLVSFTGKNEKAQAVILDAIAEAGYFILREKMRYSRARPNQLAPDLTTVLATPKHPAYPSGHAGQSYAGALILAQMDTKNAAKYLQLARDIGHRREIAGVHYPSDTLAGQLLAEQVIEKLMQVPAFKLKFDKAKADFQGS